MSIINDALKKTDQQIHLNSCDLNLQAQKKTLPRPFLLYALILLVGIVISNFIFGLIGHKIKTVESKNISLVSTKETVPSLPTPPLLRAEENMPEKNNLIANKQDFALNGIFYSNNDGYALINNQIVRENDSVDGAKVLSITIKTVELDNQGELINLSTLR